MKRDLDLNINNIRKQINTDFAQILDTPNGQAQKNILTWLELRERINRRIKVQKEKGVISFNKCLEEWSKGSMSYPELLKKAKTLIKKEAKGKEAQIKEIEEVFNQIGEKPIEAKELGTFKKLGALVIDYFKNMFQAATHLFKQKYSGQDNDTKKASIFAAVIGRKGHKNL